MHVTCTSFLRKEVKDEGKANDWQALSGTRRRKVFCAGCTVICGYEHWQEAAGKGRLGQLPALFGRQQKGKVRLIFSKSSSAWEMQKLIFRRETYTGLLEWQAEIMGVWEQEGRCVSLRFFNVQFHTQVRSAMSTAASPNRRHQSTCPGIPV